MKELDILLQAEQDIYDYFNYEENWRKFPIDDARDYIWQIDRDGIRFSKNKEDYINNNNEHIYFDEIYQNQIYRGKDFTAVITDTHTDGNIFFSIFDNSKEMKNEI